MFSANPTPEDIFLARLFEEPLVPIGADPATSENAALAAALLGYSNRSGPDDFSSLTDFFETYPTSPWNAALLVDLGLEYYHTGHYSKALDAWTQAWQLARAATDPKGKALANRAVGELAYMHARLGHMTELEALLKSVEGRVFSGSATEMITGAREALWTMRTRPEIAFRCGPLALHRIKLSVDPENPGSDLIHAAASTPNGCSLLQVAQLSHDLGLNLQMVFRAKDAAFVVPSVAHLKLDHYAAIVRQEADRYLLEDPTFGNGNWVSREALAAEASGYFLIPPGDLASGWRAVDAQEGETVWGKGLTTGNDRGPTGPCDPNTGNDSCPKNDNDCKANNDDCAGMAVPRVHLMLVSLNINDEPVGYSPPVGPAIRFKVRYNQRDAFQPANFTYSNFGPKWTFDWLSYIKDNPSSLSADVTYYMMGGGTRTFTGFDSSTQTYAFQQFDQTRLTRTSPNTYEMLSRDGTRKVFGQSDGSIATSRKIFLTQLIDPFGNAASLTYDTQLRVVAITDAIGRVTNLSYDHPTDMFKITRVTDPFGRFATFGYDASGRLIQITDAIGITSQFTYDAGDFITTLTTPYGVTTFTKGENGTTRSLETLYPDGNRERVEYNQSTTLGTPGSDPPQTVPGGMATRNEFLFYRNTYYWSKIAYANAYPDYTKAKLYHWLHTTDLATTSGILESVKEPLEGRVWYDYAGQSTSNGSIVVGSTNRPTHVGRVLDDGSTQLYTYDYNDFGNIIREVDPVGRTFSYTYAANGVDLLEIRQTRAGQNEVLSQMTYNAQHLPLTFRDAAGQTTTFTYNARGQLLTKTNSRGETITYSYDANGYLTRIDGALPGTSTIYTYDGFGRVRTRTDLDGYTLTLDYDAIDRITNVTYPDGTFVSFAYNQQDKTVVRDRAGRSTFYEFDAVGQRTKQTDSLGRVIRYQWCKCGDLRSITDPIGRTTAWVHDIQGRPVRKEFPDGSKITYIYEHATSRLKQVIDEKLQVKQFNYNRDESISSINYSSTSVATPSVQFSYDPNYRWFTSITDGIGTTRYTYYPITPVPSLGAGQIAAIDGPFPNDTIAYTYDELGRVVSRSINGVETTAALDAIGRITNVTNALGTFAYSYEGGSRRVLSISQQNGLTATFHYLDNLGDHLLDRITHQVGATPISEFSQGFNAAVPHQIISWSQQSDTQVPKVYSFGYDQGNQLLTASLSQAGNSLHTFAYTYDLAGNRLSEQVDAITRQAAYNALNQLTTREVDAATTTSYEWDAEQRLTAVEGDNQRSEFTYDWQGRRVRIRYLENGVEVSDRRFVWCDSEMCEERAADGTVVKRFFEQGVKVETGVVSGQYVYTRDHLGSIRELIDAAGAVRCRYDFDPYGRRTKSSGDLDADFGFTGYFFDGQTALYFPLFRAYDAELGRWLSRDPLESAEIFQGPNLYVYVSNDPVNLIDPQGLEVYVCKRPARIHLGPTLRWLSDLLGIDKNHWWIKTSKHEFGMGNAPGAPDRYNTPTVQLDQSDSYKDPEAHCERVPTWPPGVDEECVDSFYSPGTPTGAWSWQPRWSPFNSNNCQSYVQHILDACFVPRSPFLPFPPYPPLFNLP